MAQLAEWWRTFAPQLAVAARAGLIRIAFTVRSKSLDSQEEQVNAMREWRQATCPDVPLFVFGYPRTVNYSKKSLAIFDVEQRYSLCKFISPAITLRFHWQLLALTWQYLSSLQLGTS